MKSKTTGAVRLMFLSAATLSMVAHGQKSVAPVVGVLRPQMASSGQPGMQQQLQQELKKMPASMRPQMQQLMEKAAENAGLMQSAIKERLPLIVQQTWIDTLAQKGVAAVAMDAEAVEAAGKEAGVKNVQWLLQTSVRTEVHKSDQERDMGHGLRATTSVSTVSLKLTRQLAEAKGNVLLPSRESVYKGDVDEMGSGTDVWGVAGQEMATAVAAALPLGSTRPPDTQAGLPPAPDMTNSVRFDIQGSDGYMLKGKLRSSRSNEEDKKIFELAGDMVACQDSRRQGFLFSGSTGQIYIVNDKERSFYELTPGDWAFSSSISQQAMSQTDDESTKHSLVKTGTEGNVSHYRDGEAGPDPSRVDIEFAAPLPAWQTGMKALKALQIPGNDHGVVTLGSDRALASAIWEELMASPAPPRRITIKDRYAVTEVNFVQGPPPRAVDFTIPANYTWHSSPMLSSIVALQ